MEIINKFLPANCYTAVNTKKTRICLHHTVSAPKALSGIEATFAAQRNVATQYYIEGDGKVYKLIPDDYWAHHLGLKTSNNTQLNQETIGIELSAWGILTKKGDQFINAYGRTIDKNLSVEVLDKSFRGSVYYQEYTKDQINAVYMLIIHLCIQHNIPRTGLNKTLNFELLNDFSAAGIYSHSNFRADKSDVYPARYLMAILKML